MPFSMPFSCFQPLQFAIIIVSKSRVKSGKYNIFELSVWRYPVIHAEPFVLGRFICTTINKIISIKCTVHSTIPVRLIARTVVVVACSENVRARMHKLFQRLTSCRNCPRHLEIQQTRTAFANVNANWKQHWQTTHARDPSLGHHIMIIIM